MADIEMVIKIPKELKEGLDSKKKETAFNYMRVYDVTLCDALRNGILLPKGHGRLIDADALFEKHPEFDTYPFPSTTIDNALTIIPADMEGE